MSRIIPLSLVRKPSLPDRPRTVIELRAEVKRTVEETLDHVEERAADPDARLREVERELRAHVFAFGRALLALLFALVEQRVLAAHAKGTRFDWFGRSYRVAPAIGRNFSTIFGVLR